MKMSLLSVVPLVLALSGCGGFAAINQLGNNINTTASQLVGTYTAPLLGSSPGPSGCSNPRCRQLDELEATGYDAVHQKRTTWSNFVYGFYEGRHQLFPNSNDSAYTREFISYQHMLAQQIDAGKLTEVQWVYMVDRKYADLQALSGGR